MTETGPTDRRGSAGDDRRKRPPPGGGRLRSSIFPLMLLFGLLLVFSGVFSGAEKTSYKTFRDQLAEHPERFVSVEVSPTSIVYAMKETADAPKEKAKEFRTTPLPGDEENLAVALKELKIPDYDGGTDSDGLGGFIIWSLLSLVLLVVVWMFIMRRLGPSQTVMSFGKSRAKIVAEKETEVTFADVAGADEAVEEVREIVEFLREPKKFQELGARIPKGVLLLGAPGTGKTLLARAVAGEAGVTFFTISGSDFVEMFVGVGASRVRDLFQQAQQHAPCIVFIDELDALGRTRGANPNNPNEEREQTLNQLLVEMDGFAANTGVIIIAATNRPEILDKALLRPGRFDRQIVVDRPDIAGREAILRVHARKVRLAPNIDLHTIASRTPGFVGADLANIINEAALLAARRGAKAVEHNDMEEAIDRVFAGLERKSRLMSPKEKRIVAWHETGHALVASMLPGTNPVHRISIIPRGIAALGYTMQLPTEDRFLMTKSELENKIAVLLGGRVSEEICFGEISTGARDDLRKATDIAKGMIMAYGMSEKLGQVSFDRDSQPLFLQQGMGRAAAEYSEETAREIDAEVREIIAGQHARVTQLLKEQLPSLQKAAVFLISKETISGDELKAIVAEQKRQAESAADGAPIAAASG